MIYDYPYSLHYRRSSLISLSSYAHTYVVTKQQSTNTLFKYTE